MRKNKYHEKKCFPQILSKNMEAIKKHYPDIVESLENSKVKAIKIDDDIKVSDVKNPLVLTLVGFSTRKLLDSFHKCNKKENRKIIIIEPNLEVFNYTLLTEDISDLIEDRNIKFVVGVNTPDIINVLFSILTLPQDNGTSTLAIMKSIEIIADPFQFKDNEKLYKDIFSYIETAKKQLKLSLGCSDDQFNRFTLMIKNIETMFSAHNGSKLVDKFKDCPCFILGGGPSLDDFIKNYKDIDKSLIIASDAVLRKLLDNNIKPHIVVRCERKYTNIFKGISKEDTKGIYYAAYPWTPVEFFELFDDVIYLFRKNGVCNFTDIKHISVDGGVSAANACMEIAIMLGCKDIYMSGIDLAFIDGKSHTEGTQVEFNANTSKKKWTKVKSNCGKETTTIPVWERCRNEYAIAIDKWRKQNKQFRIINTSPNGAVINSTIFKEYKDIKKDFEGYKHIDISKRISSNLSRISEKEKSKFIDKVSETKRKTKEWAKLIEVAISLYNDAFITASNEIDKRIKIMRGIYLKNSINFLIDLKVSDQQYLKLFQNLTRAVDDNFKLKVFNDKEFRTLLFDTLQLDLFNYENDIAALRNTYSHEDIIAFKYAETTNIFMIKCLHYCNAFYELFSSVDIK